jgi:hypothetical protein
MGFRKNSYSILMVVLCFLAPLGARADIQGLRLSDACDLLTGMGFPTTGWRTYYDTETGCSSRQKSIGPGNPFRNQMAYYVDGHGQTVQQLRLILSVLNSEDPELALAEFQKAAEFLIMKITGKPAPDSISNGFSSKINRILKLGAVFVEITRTEWTMNTDWDSRRCYEIKLIIR